jgi:hypothetical protein
LLCCFTLTISSLRTSHWSSAGHSPRAGMADQHSGQVQVLLVVWLVQGIQGWQHLLFSWFFCVRNECTSSVDSSSCSFPPSLCFLQVPCGSPLWSATRFFHACCKNTSQKTFLRSPDWPFLFRFGKAMCLQFELFWRVRSWRPKGSPLQFADGDDQGLLTAKGPGRCHLDGAQHTCCFWVCGFPSGRVPRDTCWKCIAFFIVCSSS